MTKYYLNPDYTLRPDGDRYLLSSHLLRKYESDETKVFIHPIHAWILSLFSTGSSIKDAVNMIADELNISSSLSESYILPLIENKKGFVVRIQDARIHFPKNLILPENRIIKQSDIQNIIISPPSEIEMVDLATKRHHTPYLMTFMLTNKCLTKCCYCYADTDTKVNKYISTDRILQIIRDAKKIGVYNILLIGGEVFLHPDWDIILKEIVDNGYSPNIISTKLPITSAIITKLVASGYKGKIQLSIDTFIPEIAEETLTVKGSYINKIIAGIKLLEQSNVRYKIETVLTKKTAVQDNIDKLYSILKQGKNIEGWEIRSAMFSHNKSERNFHEIKASKNDLIAIYEYIAKKIVPNASFPVILPRPEHNKEYFIAENGSSSFKGARCSALNQHLFVLPDGKCTICEQLYWNPYFIIGNLNHQSIMEVWDSKRVHELLEIQQESIQMSSPCHDCNLFKDCYKVHRNRCWSDVIKAYGADKWDYPDPRCNYAPEMTHNISYK